MPEHPNGRRVQHGEGCDTCPADEAALAHQVAELGINIEYIVYLSGFARLRVLTEAGFYVSAVAASRNPHGNAAAANA